MKLDFCVVEVQLIHALEEEEPSPEGPTIATDAELLKIDNTQLNIELEISESAEMEGNKFKLSIWNLPKNTAMSANDYVIIEYYWQAYRSRGSGQRVGLVTSVTAIADGLDVKYVFTGTILENYLFTTKKVAEPTIIKTLGEYLTLIQKFGYTQVASLLPDIRLETEFIEPILATDRTLMDITNEVRELLVIQTGLSVKIRLDFKTLVVFYDGNADTEAAATDVIVIDKEDVFRYKESLDRVQGESFYIYLEIFGLPHLKRTSLIKYDGVIYQVEEIINNFTLSDGYNMKIYAKTNIPEIIATEEE